MKKLTLVVMISLFGCNYGSSIAHQSAGGSTTASTGGSSGSGSGGRAAAGGSGSQHGGSGATSSGGSAGAGSGGTAAGGATSGAGGTAATGGSSAADAGRGGRDGSATGDSSGADAGRGGRDGSAAGGTAAAGGATAAGGTKAAGGASGNGGAVGTGGASGTGGSTSSCVPEASGGETAMNPGLACLFCHGPGGRKPIQTAGGTLYATATGGAAVSGATVTITGSDGAKITLVTGDTGNFYTGSAISFPATVEVSKCPDIKAMVDTIKSGDCNSCHSSSKRIHLP